MKGKRIVLISIVAVLGTAVIVFLSLLGVYFFAKKSKPRFIAHRGYSGKYQDNTAEAFRAAVEAGFYGIETDIYETADGYLVCNHDREVLFADGTKKEIRSSTFAELTEKPIKNTKTDSDLYLCTFEDYLRICAEGKVQAVIEIKELSSKEKTLEMLAKTDELYDRTKTSFIDFNLDTLLYLQSVDPTLSLQYLSETKRDENFETCLEKGISISVRQTVLTKSLAKKFHEKNLTVNVWTVNKTFDLQIVRIKQVDYVTTNVFYKG